MREAPPPYRGEGRHALWHVSEDDSIRRFEPRDGKIWAIGTRLLPLYWFPRDCPRATFWAESETTGRDLERFLGGDRSRRVHAVEPEWLERMRTQRVVAYRMPEETFVENEDRFWISADPVEPLDRVELGDLVARHDAAAIELRTEEDLLGFWDEVVGSSLGYSGIRLRNARMPA
ncbi:MAG TPA: hypothetical protein VFM43_03295 [Gaiellaceae bacterium]|nr:hypothetical protein [Gaiellaceae bacterium]